MMGASLSWYHHGGLSLAVVPKGFAVSGMELELCFC